MMKRFLAPLALLAVPFLGSAQDLPAPSPLAKVEQRIGLADISVTYSRPSMKGRKVFGDLVPFGQIWRTGANKSTIFVTTSLLYIGDSKLPPGKYSVFTMPMESAWEIIFNKNVELWGADGYKPEEDVLRVKAIVRPASATETFTIGFENLSMDKGELVFRWEKTEVSLPIEANATEQGVANITAELAKPDADSRAFARSAAFYLERGIDPKVAYEYASKSVTMDKKYWNLFYLAKAQAALEMYADASKTGREAAALAATDKDAGAQKSYLEKAEEWAAKAAGK